MKILVTGAKGFVGKNLCLELKNRGYSDIIEYDKDSSQEELDSACKDVDFIFHLAGVNRPENVEEFKTGNADLTDEILSKLKKYNNKARFLLSSSIQAEQDNPYGRSKKAGENYVVDYAKSEDVEVYIYRFSNLFGKWSRPNYNSVVATWCHNIARGLDIQINDESHVINLVYIDDVVGALIKTMENDSSIEASEYYSVEPEYPISLGELARTIKSFAEMRESRLLPDLSDPLTGKLYSTYTSYIPEDDFSYDLVKHEDHRGSFTEIFRSHGAGQVSVNISKSGISKGEHWHTSKVEKYLVVQGKAQVNLRQVFSDEVITYEVSSEKLEVIDIPTGYVHNIVNIGDDDLITVMWANENFDPKNPDTHPENV